MWGLRVSLPRSSNAPSYPIVQAELDHLSTQHLRIVSLETSPVDDPQKIHHMTSSWFHIRCLVVIQFKDVQNKQSALNTPDFKRPQDAATIWLPCLVRKPQGSQAAGWPQNDQCHGENDDQPWHFGVHQKKTSDFISETPDLFQFVVPTKAATNKQHNSTRWWVSVLSWFPISYISPISPMVFHTPTPNLLVLWISSLWTWQPCPACYPTSLDVSTYSHTYFGFSLRWDKNHGSCRVKHLGPAMVLTHPMGFSAEEIMVSLFVTWYGYESKAWPCTPGYPWRPLK